MPFALAEMFRYENIGSSTWEKKFNDLLGMDSQYKQRALVLEHHLP